MHRVSAPIVLGVLLLAIATFHSGASGYETLISQVIWQAGQTTEDDCNPPDLVVYSWGTGIGSDRRSWATDGEYTCPNQLHGYIGANPNPLVASAGLACALTIRDCDPTFSEPTRGVDSTGAFASVTATSRSIGFSGCENGGTTTFTVRTSSNVYDISSLCQRDNDADGYSPDVSPNTDCNDGDADIHPGAPEECYLTAVDKNCDGTYDFESEYCQANTPVIIDTEGDGIRLSDGLNGVYFNLNPDGFVERLPWTLPGSDDAWLVLDRNGNGTIDDGTELFGNYAAQPVSGGPNGFLAFAVFDGLEAGGNGDGWIDREDAIFSQLLLWRDTNHDGVSQPHELSGLARVGLRRISLEYQELRRVDEWGNWFRYRARVVDTRGENFGRWAYDVYLGGKLQRSSPFLPVKA